MTTSPKFVRYHDGERFTAAIAIEGRTRLHLAVITDSGVTALDVPLEEGRYCSPLEGRIDKAARRMLKAGRQLGITKGAREILQAATT
jgi:hypothetical protein